MDAFAAEISDPDWHTLWDGYAQADCLAEADDGLVAIADRNPTKLPTDAEEWFIYACYPSSYQFSLELTYSFIGDREPTELPDLEPLTVASAVSACNTPFEIARDLDVEYEFTDRGVCYMLDFTPSAEQVASGLVPCESS